MTSWVLRVLSALIFFAAGVLAIAQAGGPAAPVAPLPPGKSADVIRKAMLPAAQDAAQFIINKRKAIPGSLPQVNLSMVELEYFEQVLGSGSEGTQQLRAFYTAAAETARTDKQNGASASSKAGSTSIVDKPGIAALLGIAVEHGAVAQT